MVSTVTEPSPLTVRVRVVRFLHACGRLCTLRAAEDAPRMPLPTAASASPVSIGSNAASVEDCATSCVLSDDPPEGGMMPDGDGDVPPPPPHPARSAAAARAARIGVRIEVDLMSKVRRSIRCDGAGFARRAYVRGARATLDAPESRMRLRLRRRGVHART